jgi:hypothetical protein
VSSNGARKAAAVVSLLALPLIGAIGCGAHHETSAPTTAAFLNQAKTICAHASVQLERAGRSFFGSDPQAAPTESRFVDRKVVPIFGGALEDLNDLPPPEGDEHRVAVIIRLGSQALTRLRAKPKLIKAAPGGPTDPFADFGRATKGYGLACAS